MTRKPAKLYRLLDMNGVQYLSPTKGECGGHRGLKIYGHLDCPSALKFIAQGKYVQHRVFFADAITAVAAGYRPCGHCMKAQYEIWRDDRMYWNCLVSECRDHLLEESRERRGKAKQRGIGPGSTEEVCLSKPRRQQSRR